MRWSSRKAWWHHLHAPPGSPAARCRARAAPAVRARERNRRARSGRMRSEVRSGARILCDRLWVKRRDFGASHRESDSVRVQKVFTRNVKWTLRGGCEVLCREREGGQDYARQDQGELDHGKYPFRTRSPSILSATRSALPGA